MNGSQSYQLQKQLELAEMVVKIASSHMWEIHARDLCSQAVKTQEEIRKAMNKARVEEGLKPIELY